MAYQQTYANGYVPPQPPVWAQSPFPQPAYGHQAPPQHPSAPPHNGPPLKKQKGNPVITKYPPPPPGWKPPFQTTGYQPPVAAYESHPHAAPTPGHYQASQSPYQPPNPYSQQSYQADPNQAYQYDQAQAYQYDPNQAYQQPPYQPPLQAYHQYQQAQAVQPPYQLAQAYPAPLPPTPAPQAQAQAQAEYYDTDGTWQTVLPPYSVPPPHQSMILAHTGRSFSMTAASEDGNDRTNQSAVEFEDVDVGHDYSEGVSITDEVDPRFSLGLITWKPAEPRKKPLPGTFKEAELEDLAQAKSSSDEDEAISKYFVRGKEHGVELSIRQTDEWEQVKNDLIFVEFARACEVVPLLTVIENRARPDSSTGQIGLTVAHPTKITSAASQDHSSRPGPSMQSIERKCEEDSDGDQAMDMSDDDEDGSGEPTPKPLRRCEPRPEIKQVPSKRPATKQTNVLDSLERALGSNDYPKLNKPSKPPPSARYSRSRSPEKMHRSRQGSQQPRGRPSEHPRDAAQESILAALGVEGSPKMVFPTPPPALGPSVSPDRNRARSPERFFPPPPHNGIFHHPYSAPYGPNFPPPPPPREARSPSLDPWKAHEAIHGDPRRVRSPSASSQRTAAGSDFHPDGLQDMDATPKANPPPPPPSQDLQGGLSSSGRKRTYDHVVESESDRRRRQPDDTPRARRKPNFDRTDAYSRRW